MKKLLALLLALVMVFALCACGGTDADTEKDEAKETQTAENNRGNESTDETKPTVVTYTVNVVDEAGNPVPDTRIAFEDGDPDTATSRTWTNEDGTVTMQNFPKDFTVTVDSVPTGYAEDTTEYTFEEGSYELTITLKAE